MRTADRTQRLRGSLAETLAGRGVLRSLEWRQSVERVPRHVFVPQFLDGNVERESGYRLIDGRRQEQQEHWLGAVYSPDESLVTYIDAETEYPTSSATMPSMVVGMLEALDVAPDHRVLEIGTGSGYSTALLCDRLGSDNITSIDIHAEAVSLARQRLHTVGYTPTVVVGDGFQGYPPNALYDRVISTCQTSRVPVPWVNQTRENGLVLAVLPGGLIRLISAGDGSASGRFHPEPVGFMWMRGGHSPDHLGRAELTALVNGVADSHAAPSNLWTILEGAEISAFWPLALLLYMPFCDRIFPEPGQVAMVAADDLSWIRIDAANNRVTQGGPRRLWDSLVMLHELLDQCDRPDRQRLGITVSADGRQHAWLDDPSSDHRWELPSLELARPIKPGDPPMHRKTMHPAGPPPRSR